MAYVSSDPNMQQGQTQDPNVQTNSPQQTGGSNSSGSSGTNTSSGSSAPSGKSATSGGTGAGGNPTPAATSSGSFQNLQSYLKANQNYNGGQGLAGQVGNTLTNNAQAAQSAQDQSAQSTISAANKAAAQYDPNNVSQYVNQALSDPTKADASTFQQYYNGTYNAPTAFDASGSFQNANANFQTQAGQTGTDSGRMALLQSLYNTPQYSSGQQNLDNLLLTSNSGQLGQLQNTANTAAKQLGTDYTTQQTNAGNAITQGQAAATAAANQTQGLFNNYVTQQEGNLNNQVAQTQQQRQDQYNQLVQQAQNGQLSSQVMQQLGLTSGQNLYGVNASNYLNNNVGTVGIGNVATAADQAKFQALANLSGQTQLANYANPTQQLGNVYTANQAGLQNQLKQNEGTLENAFGGVALGGTALSSAQLQALTPAQIQQYTNNILNPGSLPSADQVMGGSNAMSGGANISIPMTPQQQAVMKQLQSIYGNGYQTVKQV
jgi:hypothetical protein